MDNEHRCILLMAFWMHRDTGTRSWGPLLCHSSTTINSCCSMIMHGPMLQGSVHNSWKLKTSQFLHGQHIHRTCHPLSMFGMPVPPPPNTAKLHILEWPFIVASLRHTCVIIMLSNQHPWYVTPVRWMDYLSKGEVLSNTDLDIFVNNIWDKLAFCVHSKCMCSLHLTHPSAHTLGGLGRWVSPQLWTIPAGAEIRTHNRESERADNNEWNVASF